jgi:hypothetical protein
MVQPSTTFDLIGSNHAASWLERRQALVRTEQHRFYLSPDFLNSFTAYEVLTKTDETGFIILPFTRRWGIKKLWIPPFCQRLEWQGDWTASEIRHAMLKIQRRFLLIHTNLGEVGSNQNIKTRPNYVLDLNRSYKELHQEYSKDLKKTLRKQPDSTYQIEEVKKPEDTVELYRTVYGGMNPHLNESAYNNLIKYLRSPGATYRQWNLRMDHELAGSIVLVKSAARWHYILGAPTEKGRTVQAVMRLLDQAINDLSESEALLDFEGSQIQGVAKVYRSFGSDEEHFYEVRKRLV